MKTASLVHLASRSRAPAVADARVQSRVARPRERADVVGAVAPGGGVRARRRAAGHVRERRRDERSGSREGLALAEGHFAQSRRVRARVSFRAAGHAPHRAPRRGLRARNPGRFALEGRDVPPRRRRTRARVARRGRVRRRAYEGRIALAHRVCHHRSRRWPGRGRRRRVGRVALPARWRRRGRRARWRGRRRRRRRREVVRLRERGWRRRRRRRRRGGRHVVPRVERLGHLLPQIVPPAAEDVPCFDAAPALGVALRPRPDVPMVVRAPRPRARLYGFRSCHGRVEREARRIGHDPSGLDSLVVQTLQPGGHCRAGLERVARVQQVSEEHEIVGRRDRATLHQPPPLARVPACGVALAPRASGPRVRGARAPVARLLVNRGGGAAPVGVRARHLPVPRASVARARALGPLADGPVAVRRDRRGARQR